MGSNLETYWAYYEAAWANPPASLAEAGERYFTDDFQSRDSEGNAQMDKAAYMGLSQLLFASFADFAVVIHDVHEEGDDVILRSHFEGTHTSDLDLSAAGVGVFPASGRRIVWPEATTRWTFAGDQITGIQNVDEGGGIATFLAPLGASPPSA